MASTAQINANRLNAQKSTGPRSDSGKAVSRLNALKHGLDAETFVLPGENLAEYQALADAYRQANQPRTPDQHFHVDALIRTDWQVRRLQRIETDLYRTIFSESPTATLAAGLLMDTPATRLLARVQRQIAAFERAWYRAFRELRRTREEADPDTPPPAELASFPQPRVADPPAGAVPAKPNASNLALHL